ncbi:MAG: F0F1 ATP synthase subunit epsilon [Eggerthellaceae bacterium]|jgi:F-type H+-transporting ATPase subunit epsilon
MPNNAFRCVVVKPTREIFTGDVYYAEVPSTEGLYGVLPGHESLVASVPKGGVMTVWLDPDGKEKRQFLLHTGASQVLHDHLTVCTRFGAAIDEIDYDEVQKKADALRAEIEKHKSAGDDAANDSWLETNTAHLEWYESELALRK